MKKLAFLVVLAVAGLGTAPAVARSAKAQGCFPRSETGATADGLPSLEGPGTGDIYSGRRQAKMLAVTLKNRIEVTFPGVVSITTGPGFGRAWTRDSRGNVTIVPIKDYWLIVTLSDESQCPTYPGTTDRVQVGGMPGVGLFFRHL